jgi:hypothetical protein
MAASGGVNRQWFAQGFERDPLHGPLGRRLAHPAEELPSLADGLPVAPARPSGKSFNYMK